MCSKYCMTIGSSHVVSIYPHQVNFEENPNQYLIIVPEVLEVGF